MQASRDDHDETPIAAPTGIDAAFANFCATRDQAALAIVFAATADKLVRQARRHVGNAAEAEDVVQQLFLSLLDRDLHYDATRPCWPFLRGALRNHATKSLRRAARTSPAGPSLTEDPAATAAQREAIATVQRAIDGLPDHYRVVVRLYLLHGLTPQEIAVAIARPAGTTRVQLQRGLAMLRRVLPSSLALLTLFSLMSGRPAAAQNVLVRPRRSVAAAVAAIACIGAVVLALGWRARPLAVAAGIALPQQTVASEQRPAPPPTGATPLRAEATTMPVLVVAAEDRHGAAVRDACVSISAAGSHRDFGAVTAVTDAAGLATFDQLPWDRVRVSVDRGFADEVQLTTGTTARLRARCAGGAVVRGRVVDANGRPLAGAELLVSGDPDVPLEANAVGRSDATGAFELTAMLPFAAVAARLPGMAPSTMHLAGNHGRDDLELRILERGATVVGRVRGPTGPVVDALVLVGREPRGGFHHWNRDFVNVYPERIVRTDADGAFVAGELPPGKLQVLVTGRGIAPTLLGTTVAAGAIGAVDIVAAAGTAITGKVVDADGRGVAGAEVLAPGLSPRLRTMATTDHDGCFVLPGSDSRRRLVEVTATGYSAAWQEFGPEALPLLVALQPESRITGQVVAADGRPADPSRWEVHARHRLGEPGTVPVEFDGHGNFDLPRPGRSFAFAARQRGSTVWVPCAVRTDAGHRVQLPAAAAELVPLTLRLHGLTAEQLADAEIYVGDAAATGPVRATIVGDALRTEPLPAQTWQVQVRGRSGVCPPIHVGEHTLTAASASLAVAAPPFGWLQYEIQDTDGNQPAALSAFVVNEAAVHVTRLLPRGRIALTEGRWSLHGKAAELAPIVDQPFTIVAGQETFARFTTHPARISQIAFWLPDPGCGYQLTLRHGDEEIVSARASSLLRVGRDGYCWLMGTLPEGEHVLTLVGPNDSWRTRFTVHGDLPLGQPLLVTLEALP